MEHESENMEAERNGAAAEMPWLLIFCTICQYLFMEVEQKRHYNNNSYFEKIDFRREKV